MQVIHFVIHILIICLGYIYRTLAKWYLLSCSHCLVFFYSSKCPPPAPMHFTALAFMPIIALLIMQGQSVPPKKWAAKTARSAGREFLAPLLLWNSIARKDRWGWLNCRLGGIFVLESLGQKNTISYQNIKTIWDKFITCTHTFTCCQRRAWCFTCIWKSFIRISHCQQ